MEKVFYKDKFVELHDDKLIIKWYYFPTTKAKIIPLTDFMSIYHDTQESSMVFTIGWGMTIFGVWWGCDARRQFPSFKTKYSNVILDTGSAIKKGFTVENIDRFLGALQLLKSNVLVVNTISDKFDGKFQSRTKKDIYLKETDMEIEALKEKEKNLFKYPMNNFYINDPPPSYDEAVKEF